MNKQTRIFIFGMFLIAVCGTATGVQVAQLIQGTFKGGIRWVLLFVNIAGCISGGIHINRSLCND